MHILLYTVDACPVNHTFECSLEFLLTKIMMLLKTYSKDIATDCQLYFGLPPVADAIKKRK